MTFDWATLAFQYGVPVIILFGIGWFVSAQVWPKVTTWIERSMAASAAKDEKFVEALETQRTQQLAAMDRLEASHEQAMAQQRAEFLAELLRVRMDTNDALKQLTAAVNNLTDIVHVRLWNGTERRTPQPPFAPPAVSTGSND